MYIRFKSLEIMHASIGEVSFITVISGGGVI
jgi:hypothetical protein